jgi:putative membrane protein
MTRPAFSLLGVTVLVAAWATLLVNREHPAFSAHMAVHMGIVVVAAPLLAAGLAGSLRDPVRRAPGLFSPLLASLLELAVVWVWHSPVLHELARRSTLALLAEQASFLITGLLLWISVLGGSGSARIGEGIVALLLTAMHMTLLGALLALAPRAFYGSLHGNLDWSALADQQVGGAIMILMGGASYLFGALWLSLRLLRYGRP